MVDFDRGLGVGVSILLQLYIYLQLFGDSLMILGILCIFFLLYCRI